MMNWLDEIAIGLGGALSLPPRRERRSGGDRGRNYYRPGRLISAQRKKYMDKSRERYVMRKRAEEAGRVTK